MLGNILENFKNFFRKITEKFRKTLGNILESLEE